MRYSNLKIRLLNILVLTASCVAAQVEASHDENHAASRVIDPQQGPHLTVILRRSGADSRPLVAPGQVFTLVVGVDNLRGQADAHESVLTVTLPKPVTLSRAVISPNRTERANDGSSTLTWHLNLVKAHAFPHLFKLDLSVPRTIDVPAEFTVSARVTASDQNAVNENSAAPLTVYVTRAAADLTLDSDLEGVALTTGAPNRFNVTVRNFGNLTASNSTLKVILPSGVNFVRSDPQASAPGETTLWQLGDVEPGGSAIVKITVSLDATLAANIDSKTNNVLRFQFDVSTPTVDSNSENNHLQIEKRVERAGFDARVWLTVDGTEPGELPIGRDVTYSLTYGNFGNQLAPKSAVSLSLPGGLTLVSADPTPARSSQSDQFLGGVAGWDSGDLRIGESKLIKCRVHVASVPKDGSVVVAKVTADGNDIDTRNNVAYSWRRAPRGAARIATAAGASLPPAGGHSHLWVWVVLLLAMAAVAWALIRAKGKTREE